jgi:hypothetical protein
MMSEGQTTSEHQMLWRRLDRRGHEAARLSLDFSLDPASWHLTGTAAFAYEGDPCLLSYQISGDPDWRTVAATVTGWVGARNIEVHLARDAADQWTLNGEPCPAVAGCLDLDLNFSPSTNLLPIRRLDLAVGQTAEVRAAWLRFPEFTLEPLPQVYRRTSATTYRYESSGGAFVAHLTVNAVGFVTRYPRFWQADIGRA